MKVVKRVFEFVGITLVMMVFCLYCVMWVCTKGPSEQIKNLFVLSVRESSAGGFLASIYLDKDEIAEIEANNTVVETDEVTDTSIVQVATKKSLEEEVALANSIEDTGFIVESLFDTNVYVENGIEFHDIAGSTFTGKMLVIPDPDRVFIGTPRDVYDGQAGLSVPDICERYGAIAAVNGGFFEDTNGVGNGGTPLGFVVSNGKLMWGSLNQEFNMMGFNQDGILICGKMTGQQVLDYGIRDGLTCDPFLVINGEGVNVSGKGGGLNPRTAVGQRTDGAVLLLIVDGRQATSLGASMADMADVMLDFGAVNAGNLDGGGSTVLYYNGKVQNVVMSIYGTRGVPDAVLVKPLQ